jgi:hypothetical protein
MPTKMYRVTVSFFFFCTVKATLPLWRKLICAHTSHVYFPFCVKFNIRLLRVCEIRATRAGKAVLFLLVEVKLY